MSKILSIAVVIIILLINAAKKYSAGENGGAKSDVTPKKREETKIEPPRFQYYTDKRGRDRIDIAASNRQTGRELSEYEIYEEKKRLDALAYGQDISNERQIWDKRAFKSTGSEKTRQTFDPSDPNSIDEAEYKLQLEQLERFLKSGLVDWDEYRMMKERLEKRR